MARAVGDGEALASDSRRAVYCIAMATDLDDKEAARGAFVASLCSHLAGGGHADRWYGQDGNPSHQAVWEWRKRRKDWHESIEEARGIGSHVLVDAVVSIADGTHPLAQGPEKYPGQRKVQAWARLEAAKRINPKHYGDKSAIEHSGKLSLDSVIGETLAKHAPKVADGEGDSA